MPVHYLIVVFVSMGVINDIIMALFMGQVVIVIIQGASSLYTICLEKTQ